MALGVVRALVPETVKVPLRWCRSTVSVLPYYGKGRWCPVCEKASRKFMPDEPTSAEESVCVHCGAYERHRMVWLFLNNCTDLFTSKEPRRFLHIAPEKCFEGPFRNRLGNGYITADLRNPAVTVKMDITNIRYPDESFDIIYCSHVLEHVVEDRRAIHEFHRVLKKDGWAVILVPITAKKTQEDPSVVDPFERLRLYGEKDHVRRYGPDFVDRLKEAGFNVRVTKISDLAAEDETVRLGLTTKRDDIYFCTRQ